AGRAGGAVPVRGARRPELAGGPRALSRLSPAAASTSAPGREPAGATPAGHGPAAARRVGLVGPLHPWRGGLAQYVQLLGEALEAHAEVRAVTFTRQYPGLLFPGTSQLDPAAPRPRFPTEALLDSIGPWSWRRTAAHLERFAPGAVVLKWWMPFF